MKRKVMIEDELSVLSENIATVRSLPVTKESLKLLHVMERVKEQLVNGPVKLQDILIEKLPLLYLQIRKLKVGETGQAVAAA